MPVFFEAASSSFCARSTALSGVAVGDAFGSVPLSAVGLPSRLLPAIKTGGVGVGVGVTLGVGDGLKAGETDAGVNAGVTGNSGSGGMPCWSIAK